MDQEHTKLQQKHDAAKARNKVLASELKGLKAQVQTLLEKGAHDDELIAALMVCSTVECVALCIYYCCCNYFALMQERLTARSTYVFLVSGDLPEKNSLVVFYKWG